MNYWIYIVDYVEGETGAEEEGRQEKESVQSGPEEETDCGSEG